jgi:hypothetical protein
LFYVVESLVLFLVGSLGLLVVAMSAKDVRKHVLVGLLYWSDDDLATWLPTNKEQALTLCCYIFLLPVVQWIQILSRHDAE